MSQKHNVVPIDIAQQRRNTEVRLIKMIINNPAITERLQGVKFETRIFQKFFDRIDAYFKKGDYELNNNIIESFLSPLITNSIINNQSLKQLCEMMEFTDDEFKYEKQCLHELTTRGKLVEMANDVVRRVNTTEDLRRILNVGEHITEMANNVSAESSKTIKASFALNELALKVKNSFENGVTEENIPIPIDVLADALFSFSPNDLIVVAARPSVGKTAFGCNFCYLSPLPSGFVSSEMTAQQLVGRLISCETGLDSKVIRNPELMTQEQYQTFNTAFAKVMDLKGDSLYIDDTGNIKIDQIERDVEEWVNIGGARFVVLDYIQRFDSDRDHATKSEAIGHVTKRLKSLCKRFGIAIILLAQINRESEKGGRRPQVHDIKDCGEIEQEADIIILMHKPAMGTSAQNVPHVVELIIAKNRNGNVGTVISEFDPTTMSYNRPSVAQINLAKNNYKPRKAA